MRVFTLALSMVAHCGAIVLVVITPLVATDGLPDPRRAFEFIVVAPAAPAPPPPARSQAQPTPAVSADAAPLEAPEGIQSEIARPLSEFFETPASVVPGALGARDVSAGLMAPPPPAPRDVEPLRVGGRIQRPERTHDVAPAYPPIALAARREGTVILEAVIELDGTVRDVRVLRSVPLLDEAAMEAVRQWRFTPTLLNGDPVPVVMTVTVTFSLK